MQKRIVAIVGTYRKGGITDSVVDRILQAAEDAGAQTEKIYLVDCNIEFCTNCRSCTQGAGLKRGKCVIADEMGNILDKIEAADGIILASPMNFFQVTAVFKKFMERLVCYSAWPWGRSIPRLRIKKTNKKAVLVTSSSMPSVVGRMITGIVRTLKITARIVGAKKVAVIYVGSVAKDPQENLSPRIVAKSQKAGYTLAK